MRPPTWFEWITVAALFLGPVAALLTQRLLDQIREKKNRRVNLFFRLMATRASHASAAHVEALNSIDPVFNRKGDAEVREAWRRLLDYMLTDTSQPGWFERMTDSRWTCSRRWARRSATPTAATT